MSDNPMDLYRGGGLRRPGTVQVKTQEEIDAWQASKEAEVSQQSESSAGSVGEGSGGPVSSGVHSGTTGAGDQAVLQGSETSLGEMLESQIASLRRSIAIGQDNVDAAQRRYNNLVNRQVEMERELRHAEAFLERYNEDEDGAPGVPPGIPTETSDSVSGEEG